MGTAKLSFAEPTKILTLYSSKSYMTGWVVHGTPVKTTAEDAELDSHIFQMIMKAGGYNA